MFSLDNGIVLTVRAIVDDQWVGAAEAVTTAQDPASFGADRPRYAIFRYEGSAADPPRRYRYSVSCP